MRIDAGMARDDLALVGTQAYVGEELGEEALQDRRRLVQIDEGIANLQRQLELVRALRIDITSSGQFCIISCISNVF